MSIPLVNTHKPIDNVVFCNLIQLPLIVIILYEVLHEPFLCCTICCCYCVSAMPPYQKSNQSGACSQVYGTEANTNDHKALHDGCGREMASQTKTYVIFYCYQCMCNNRFDDCFGGELERANITNRKLSWRGNMCTFDGGSDCASICVPPPPLAA